MKLMSIASGSSGNCIYVESTKTKLLVDAGVSKKRIADGLKTIDVQLSDINGIIITHEHIDHVRGLGVISRGYGIPMYATKATCEAIAGMPSLGEFDRELLKPVSPDMRFCIGDIIIEPHSIWHDAADPVCYSLFADDRKLSVATDMGGYDDYIINAISGSDAMLIEANHDKRMLEAGPYPYQLKQRILGSQGHLSNEACGKLLVSAMNDHLKVVLLGHLSKENNYPALAYETVKLELLSNPVPINMDEFNLQVASRSTCGDLIEL